MLFLSVAWPGFSVGPFGLASVLPFKNTLANQPILLPPGPLTPSLHLSPFSHTNTPAPPRPVRPLSVLAGCEADLGSAVEGQEGGLVGEEGKSVRLEQRQVQQLGSMVGWAYGGMHGSEANSKQVLQRRLREAAKAEQPLRYGVQGDHLCVSKGSARKVSKEKESKQGKEKKIWCQSLA